MLYSYMLQPPFDATACERETLLKRRGLYWKPPAHEGLNFAIEMDP